MDKYPGKLIVLEGADGAGKTEAITRLYWWLAKRKRNPVLTEWKSSEVVGPCIKRAKESQQLTPRPFSLLHAADLADRQARKIIPALEAGKCVVADRWVYTGFARDVVRGLSPSWVRVMYNFAIVPDVAFYLKVPVETAFERVMKRRGKMKFYESGMDMHFGKTMEDSFRVFQGRIIAEYDKMVPEYGLKTIDATQGKDAVFGEIISQVEAMFSGVGYAGSRKD